MDNCVICTKIINRGTNTSVSFTEELQSYEKLKFLLVSLCPILN